MKMRKIILWMVALLGLFATGVFADAFFDETKVKAEQGQAEAQYLLGAIYAHGMEDQREAVKWYRKAAEQGLDLAQNDLGVYYFTNVGGDDGYAEAVKWFQLAAEQGLDSAQAGLGLCYANGLGISEDDREAAKWYRLAAEQGLASAQYSLGVLYSDGEGVPKDYKEAVRWYRKAADQGDANAQRNLGDCYASGDGVIKSEQDAVKWFRKAANQGNATAQHNLGVFYLFGNGVSKDKSKAYDWFLRAAENGHSSSQYCIAERYRTGDGVPVNIAVAIKWYRKSAEQGYALAQHNLAVSYDTGNGVLKDEQEAIRWYRQAADQGHVDAQCYLGEKYDSGQGVPEDNQTALKWYRLAAEQGSPRAQFFIGYHYITGEGVLENSVEAYAWYLLASMQDKMVLPIKEELKCKLTASQIAAGQQRAKELQALIERKKVIAETESEQPLSSDIAPSGFGSGLMVKGGYVLTCWHVVDGAERISISVSGKDRVAKVVQKDAANDIAVLKVSDVDGGVALNFSDEVKLGEMVFTLGYPHPDLQGSDVKFTTGTISSLTGIDNSPRYFQISAPLQAGNSGGPLFDENGNLVGMVAAKLDSLVTLAMTGDLPQNVNYAIKSDYLIPVLKTVQGLEVGKEKTTDVNLLELIEELKQSVVMIKVY